MDAGPSASRSPASTDRWPILVGCVFVLGIAVCAVLSSIEIDRLGY